VSAALAVKDLHVHFFSRDGVVKALNGVSFSLQKGHLLALVGESGAGKSVTALSILRLLPYPGRIVQGEVWLDSQNLGAADDEEMRKVRGREVAISFQDPVAALNPILTIERQMAEMLEVHMDLSRREIEERCEGLLREMGLPDPHSIMGRYPRQLSGGMAQRVILAMALSLRPRVLIADEPTSNLDVTLQAEILFRLRSLQREYGTSILFITHDMGVVARVADEVAVMYAGTIMEEGDTRSIFRYPASPYTWGLFQALPRLDEGRRSLRPIRGVPPDLVDLPEQCPFLPRCMKATVECRLNPRPPLEEMGPGHSVACYNPMTEG
jgi:peptide/nickel transport system ATP-binding protein/oligopeptide transport system ATP-binding protein